MPTATRPNAPSPSTSPHSCNSHCLDCHDGAEGEGGFDATSLDLTALNLKSADAQSAEHDLHRWVRVFDRINDGEMPPADYGEIDGEEKNGFLEELYRRIDDTESKRHAALGRVRARRLTNDQLERTLCDLLSIDLPLARLMPEEQRTDGFRNIAEAQSMSLYHLEDHLRVVDAALDYAFDRMVRNRFA